MADNLGVNVGTDANVATDDCGASGHIQRIKLDIGADGVSSPVVAGNGLPVAVESIVPGTGATNLGKAEDAAHTTGDVGVMALAVRQDVASALGGNGDYVPVTVDGAGRLWNSGQIAHDSAISGAPFRVGGRAVSADYTAVTTGDQADLICDLNGKQIVLPYAIPENHWQAVTAAKTDTSGTAIKASAGAGRRNYITSLTVTNSHATVGTVVEVKDGSTVIHRAYAAPAGGGYAVTFPTPLKGTAATAINVANITTGSNTYVSMSGYTGA